MSIGSIFSVDVPVFLSLTHKYILDTFLLQNSTFNPQIELKNKLPVALAIC